MGAMDMYTKLTIAIAFQKEESNMIRFGLFWQCKSNDYDGEVSRWEHGDLSGWRHQ